MAQIEAAEPLLHGGECAEPLQPRRHQSGDVLDHATERGIAFLPWAPISAGALAAPGGPVAKAAERLGATPSQVAIAWLLTRSPVMVPIPGTGSVGHLEENMAAAELELDEDTYAEITAAADR